MAGSVNAGRLRVRAAPTISSIAGSGRILAPVVPLVVVIYMFLLFPIETRPTVFGVNLPIYRMGILLFMPFLFARLTAQRTRFLFADWLIVMATVWTLISFGLIYGLGDGLVRASGVVIDFTGSYALGRLAIDSPIALRRFLVLIAPGLLLAGSEMLVESLSGRLIVRPFFAAVFGQVSAYQGGEIIGNVQYMQEERLGLLRAYGPFSHPILGGAVLISMLPLWVKSGLRSWPLWAGIGASMMGLYSLSSAAFLGVVFSAFLIGTDWLKRYVAGISWPLITVFLGMIVLAVELVSASGVTSVLARFTFDPQTAYFRLATWDYGIRSIIAHPWIGIGYAVYDRPLWMTPSIDAHFLAMGIRSGIPLVVLLLAAIVTAMIGTGVRSTTVTANDRELLVGLNFSTATLMLISMTVTYYGETNVWFMMMIGITATFSAGVRLDRSGRLILPASAPAAPSGSVAVLPGTVPNA